MNARAPVSPSVLIWARETAGLSVADAAGKLNLKQERVEEWEAGSSHPTINQLRNIALKYRRPLGAFLRREPPREQALPHDFRHLPGDAHPPTSASLLAQIRTAVERRKQALELYEELGEQPAIFDVLARVGEDYEGVGSRIRQALHITLDQQSRWRQPEAALTAWKERFEAAGVLVFQFTRLDLGEMRGLSIAELPLPIIVANSKDAAAGRIFTLFHEAAHIALRTSGLCDLEDGDDRRPQTESALESYCNRVAGAALVPADALLGQPLVRQFESRFRDWSDGELDQLKREFAVSRFVILRRLMRLNLASEDYYRARHVVWMAELARIKETLEAKNTIIPPFRKSLASTGKQFARLVFRAYYEDKITLNDVSEYLNLKVKHLPHVEHEVFK